MPRSALALPPTFNEVAPGMDAYVFPMQIRQLAKQHGRYWAFKDVPTTVALPANRFAKSLASFHEHQKEPAFRELLREYAEFGVERPSGYADVFHQHFLSPKIPWSLNAPFEQCLAGGWQDALRMGTCKGRYYKYDMRSAYLWAATLGMPDTSTYTRSLKPWRKGNFQGLFRVKLIEPTPTAPYPFNQCRECIATAEEIDTYGLRIERIVDGIDWQGTTDPSSIIDTIKKVSTWKLAARAYWGRWGQMSKVQCVAGAKKWHLPNLALNIPWAHSIISRVKMRLWEFSKNAVHVYVDSVITTDTLPTGTNVGDWRLEKIYEEGVIIRGPGQYGDLKERQLERMAGVAHGSLLRDTSIPAMWQ